MVIDIRSLNGLGRKNIADLDAALQQAESLYRFAGIQLRLIKPGKITGSQKETTSDFVAEEEITKGEMQGMSSCISLLELSVTSG